MNKDSKIYIAGHRGMVGSAIMRALQARGYTNLLLRSHAQLELTDQDAVKHFFEQERPEYVFLAAAKVGGIMANKTQPADFIGLNLAIQYNIIHNAYQYGVKKLLFLGSSCIYPRLSQQPIKEEYFMTGILEPTNEAYAVAKIAGITLCQSYNKQYGTNFISLMPANVYGPHDKFDSENSHVLAALMTKFDAAKQKKLPNVELWGSGTPRREFLYVEDLADACLLLMEKYNDSSIINIGTGEDVSIQELAHMIKNIVGYEGTITWDTSKPDGMPQKLLDVSKVHALGWKHTVELRAGIKKAYEWFMRQKGS